MLDVISFSQGSGGFELEPTTGFFLYSKQIFLYKQHQAEIDKKSSKSQESPWGWTFAIWKLSPFFVHIIIQN